LPSRSTGPPKGVDVSHGNVTNLLCNYPGNLNIRRGTKVAQLLSISFDMGKLQSARFGCFEIVSWQPTNRAVLLGQWEIFGTLINGGTLLIRTSDWKYVLKNVSKIHPRVMML
jgi:hypothetical protein